MENTQYPIPNWLGWARKIQAISQIGLTYAEVEYDRDRYEQLARLAAEIVAVYSGGEPGAIRQTIHVQPGYVTPKADVRGACFKDGKILLVREKSDGKWCLPGGWADVGDVPSESVAREVREEAGYACVPQKLIGLFDGNRDTQDEPLEFGHAYKLVFLCALTGGDGVHDHEILETGFFAPDALPPLSTARTDARVLRECFAHAHDAQRATFFD